MSRQRIHGKSCDFFAELTSAYLDDELSAVELLDLAEHLKSCSQCHRTMDSLFATKKILHHAEPFWTKPSPSKEFLNSVITRLESEASSSPPRGFMGISSRFIPLVAAGLATILLFIGTALYFGNYRQTMIATTERNAPEKSESQYHIAKTDQEGDLEEYVRDHTLGYSETLLIDYDGPVEFVGYVSP